MVDASHVPVAEERHQPVQVGRTVDHVEHGLLQAAQVNQRPGHPDGPEPEGLEPHVEHVPENLVRQRQAQRGGGVIDIIVWETQLIEILVAFQRRVPDVRAAVLAADLDLVHAPVAFCEDVLYLKERLDDPVVTDLCAPENLSAQPELPLVCQPALAEQIGRPDDLGPAVLRATEDHRACLFQAIVPVPELALFLLDGPGGQFGHPGCQVVQHRAIVRADGGVRALRSVRGI